ncbi:MAG: GNAT family N-acetyltransferase [Candidatus Bathyarchaeota archaeon]|nr:GNAT family N-acetyltransferase [Candidatus Bathyarchaeota archaeon]
MNLETPRLVLREFKIEDYDAIHVYATDPEVVKNMDWGPNTETDTRAFIKRSMDDRRKRPRLSYQLAITMDEELIGGCGITIQNLKTAEGEVGYVLRKDLWNKGITTEATGALLRFGFETLSLHRIIAKCNPENIGSYRVMEKNGMQREGRLRKNLKIRGEYRDTYIYSILEDEWKK